MLAHHMRPEIVSWWAGGSTGSAATAGSTVSGSGTGTGSSCA